MIVKKVIGKIVGIIFIAMGYLLVKDLSFSVDNILNIILQGWLGYFIAYIGVGFLVPGILEKSKVLSFVYNKILVLPAIGFIYFQYIITPIITVIMFLGIYFLPSMWILKLGETHDIIEQYSQGIIYILSLLSVLFFAYKSNVLMGFIIETFKTKLFRNYLNRYTNTAFTRMFTYIMMIIIYILYNFLTFSKINPNFIPSEMLNVIKEVFVTFVAIDTLIQIIVTKQQTTTVKDVENK
ncbi:TPA: hypothetical protein ACLQU7_001317 [Bacillus tropicus]|uniref:hypothetical protein n=1 Tax=Bacillus tropicus TaxID=2026188 RepID=UPI000460C03D|nr:hypothetical protein [Bacillus tropicus]AIY78145.1 putative membrane protein [Bacillus cereus]AJI03196.1 putative membrane protein [Bacillus cereus G9241]ARO17208.1 hypothetical protein B2J90_06800 [Bacillus cereus]KDB44039.1 hypothetical protein DH31_09775 [Bacillus cereus]QPS52797.1 hypothetical protein I6G54_12365 [Bacillus tropicus]